LAYSARRLSALVVVAITVATLSTFVPHPGVDNSPAVAQAATRSQAARVIAQAKRHLHARFVLGTEGPRTFDCSGLVWRSFKDAGLVSVIGGRRTTARGYWAYFRHKGLASRYNPRPGDLVIWGNGHHTGIYVGNGRAISAVTNGVMVHGIHSVRARFTTYLHTRLTN
jgi:cell wall-associated NlpC family hydrolase